MPWRALGIATAFALAFLSPAEAQVQPSSGQEDARRMAAQCEAPEGAPEGMIARGYCLGFVDGVLSTHKLMVSFHDAHPAFCPPESGLSLGEGRAIFLRWLESHPEDGAGSARQVILLALAASYPCGRR